MKKEISDFLIPVGGFLNAGRKIKLEEDKDFEANLRGELSLGGLILNHLENAAYLASIIAFNIGVGYSLYKAVESLVK